MHITYNVAATCNLLRIQLQSATLASPVNRGLFFESNLFKIFMKIKKLNVVLY